MELRFLAFENFATVVVAAFRADPMRQFPFVAVGTFRGNYASQRIMGATLGCAGLGVAPLRIGHDKILSRVLSKGLGSP
jgi:hypothetical protein